MQYYVHSSHDVGGTFISFERDSKALMSLSCRFSLNYLVAKFVTNFALSEGSLVTSV